MNRNWWIVCILSIGCIVCPVVHGDPVFDPWEKDILQWTQRSSSHPMISSVLPNPISQDWNGVWDLLKHEFYNKQQDRLNASPAPYFGFLPALVGTVFLNQSSVSWEGRCYQTVKATLSGDATSAVLEIEFAKKRSSGLCVEFYDFATREGGFLHTFSKEGTHTVEISKWRTYEYQDVKTRGLHILLFPGSREDMIRSVIRTASIFDSHSTNQIHNNVEFLAENMQWAMQPRTSGDVLLQPTDLRSGDQLAILKLDGSDPLIGYGTGGHTGHSAVVIEFEDGWYVCESTDDPNWPLPHGVIRTPYNQWIAQASEREYLVTLLRLSPDLENIFDVQAARDFFFRVQGMPYGWHNFIFSFLDTALDNLPRPISPQLYEQVMGIWENIIPKNSKASIYNFLIQGLNHRFQSQCQDLHCIYEIIDPLGLTLEEATAIPEQDEWLYQGNFSMVCSVFVSQIYKHAGILQGFNDTFTATEQTPKDSYQMAIFDTDWDRPMPCIQADPALPYCQLIGNYTLQLNGYNSISPYPHMNEKCPSLPPVYARTPTNC